MATFLNPYRFGGEAGVISASLGNLTLSAPEVELVTHAQVTQMGAMVIAQQGDVNSQVTQMGAQAIAGVFANLEVTQMGLLVLAATAPLPRVPNPLNVADRGRQEILRTRTVNMFSEPTDEGPSGWALMGRPGLKTLATRGNGPIRACFKWLGFQMVVSGANVYIDNDNIGVIPNNGPVYWAISSEQCVLVTSLRAYLVTTEDVTIIENENLLNVANVWFLAGRFIYSDADNSGIYRYSALNDAETLDGLSFASAEADPDAITGGIVFNDNLMLTGETTSEWHYSTNDNTAPFQRSIGRTYNIGCKSPQSIVETNSRLFFVGHTRLPYAAEAVPRDVSDATVAKLLRRLSTEELADVVGYEAYYEKHFFWVLKIPRGGTWAYDTSYDKWYEWKSHDLDQFRVSCSDDDIFGDSQSGKLFQFEGQTYTDDDDPLERVCSAWLPMSRGQERQFNVILMCQKAVGKASGQGLDPVVEMRFSDDLGKSFSIWSETEMAPMGQTGKEWTAEWTGLGMVSSPGRLFEFRVSDPVMFTVYQVKYNEVYGR